MLGSLWLEHGHCGSQRPWQRPERRPRVFPTPYREPFNRPKEAGYGPQTIHHGMLPWHFSPYRAIAFLVLIKKNWLLVLTSSRLEELRESQWPDGLRKLGVVIAGSDFTKLGWGQRQGSAFGGGMAEHNADGAGNSASYAWLATSGDAVTMLYMTMSMPFGTFKQAPLT